MPRHFPTAVAGAVLGTVLLSACASADEPASQAQPATSELSALNHVHGIAVDPADDEVLVATHEGLFRLSDDGDARIGPVIDRMGFAVVGPGHFVASGHPGSDADLPEPVGLIESTDGGQTWEPVSRGGESDFHALASSDGGILGYDGSLLRSANGTDWNRLEMPAAPASLVATGDGRQVLTTPEEGVLLSVDAGASWSPVPGAPVLQLVEWAADGGGAVGVDPAGGVWVSLDGASSWQSAASLDAAPRPWT